ncbi:MAG: molybdopterin cofactor-binding domain-containing protein [Kofleriaceae bacterium]
MTALSRRGFLGGLLAGGGALSLGISVGGCGGGAAQRRVARADQTGEFAPNLYITVLPSGVVSLAVNKAEIGQGVTTGYATLVAEELDVPVESIDVHFADSFPEYRTSFGIQQTGGSTSIKEGFGPLRTAAAAAREMLIGAAAASWGVPAAECTTADGTVRHAASGRSAGYGELTKLAARREVPSNPRRKAPGEFRHIGKHGRRVDARAKVDGSAIYGIDVVRPNMVRAAVVHGPTFGARPTSVRDDAARAVPGVLDVLRFPWGVAVVAEKYWQALAASRQLEITWGAGQTAGFDSEELRRAARETKARGISARDDGDVETSLGGAAATAAAIYEAPFLAHAPLEPQNCTVEVKGRRVEVWAPCQSPSVVQEFIADAIGVDRDDILVHTTLSGGGFGRRGVADFAAQAAMIARRVQRPVQMIWSRESDMTQGFYRPQTTARLRGGLDAQGRVTALDSQTIGQPIIVDQGLGLRAAFPSALPKALGRVLSNSALAMFGSGMISEPFATEGVRDTPYRIPNLRVELTPVSTGIPVSFWRSVGHSFNAFAVESFLDELAHLGKRDPLEVRRALLPEGSRPRRVLEAVAALARWGEPAAPGRGRGLARHSSFDSEVAEVAEVEVIDGRIRVHRVFCVIDCGTAVNPDVIRAQLEGAIIFGLSAALDQQITFVDGEVQQKNFDTFPPLRCHECPEIIVQILESDEAPTGVGEPGLPPLAPAVANAIFAATGRRLRRMPLQLAWNEEAPK